jgi:hypothetical protein
MTSFSTSVGIPVGLTLHVGKAYYHNWLDTTPDIVSERIMNEMLLALDGLNSMHW